MADEAESLRRELDGLDEFLYVVSHDLRSPLVTVEGFAEMLADALDANDVAEARRLLDVQRGAFAKLRVTVGALGELRRVGARAAADARVSLDQIAADVAFELGPLAEHCESTVEVAGPLGTVRATRAQAERVLHHLLANALRFGCPRPGMKARVSTRAAGEHVELSVTDDGPGLPPDQHDRAFRLFDRVNRPKPNACDAARLDPTFGRPTCDPLFGDAGVGLAVVRRAALALGGACGVESAGDGSGARFWFAFPKNGSDEPRP